MRFSFMLYVAGCLALSSTGFAAQGPILVRAGGGSYTDTLSNQTWSADHGYSGGNQASTSHQISGTLMQGLYQNERYGPGGMSYTFSVPNGPYTIALRFAEIYFNAPNKRVFNIWINGTEVKSQLDVFLASGCEYCAYDLAYPVNVTDGQVQIYFQAVIENPKIAAIEVVPVGSNVNTVQLYPGDDIASSVSSNPPGTRFNLAGGTYSNQQIFPKSGDSFIGSSGTVLSGARTLTSFGSANGLWYAGGQTQQGIALGSCDSEHPACMYPEDLFFNGTLLLRVAAVGDVASGKWYFDYNNNQIIFADNPAGKLVQTSITQSAFIGSVAGVTLENLKITMYANPAQFGAIGDQLPGPGWLIQSNEVVLNHGPGVRAGSGTQVISSYLHDNGSTGVGGALASNILIQSNEIASNNYAGYMHAFECGGGKFSAINGLTVDSNQIHDNVGPGFWTDTDNFNVVYSNNNIYNNQDNGIQHERSFNAKIYNNTVRDNGSYAFTWLWGSQILVQNSQNVEVYNNTVNVNASYGNGIGLINQNRGSGLFGAYVLQNNHIHNNDISYQAGPNAYQASGVAADYNLSQAFNVQSNFFDYNAYHLANPYKSTWSWSWSGNQSFSGFQSFGEEPHGTIDSAIKP